MIARVLVYSPAAHLRDTEVADARARTKRSREVKPNEKRQGWDGCDEANVGREPDRRDT